MSANFFLPLFSVFFVWVGYSQIIPCSKNEVLLTDVSSEKFNEAYKLVNENLLEDAFKIIKSLKDNSDSNEDIELLNKTLFLEAELHNKNKAYQKSLETYKLILSNKPSTELSFYTNMEIGNLYISGMREFDKVIPYYKEAESLLNKSSCNKKQTLVYNALGNINLLKRNYDEAENYYNKGLEIYLKDNNYNEAAINYSNLGNLFFEKYEDEKALDYFLKAIDVIRKKDSTNINTRQKVNYNLSAVYEAFGDYKTSLDYLNKANVLRDSIWNSNKVWEIAELEKKIEIGKKENELKVLDAENKANRAQRNGILASAFILLILLGVSIYNYRQKVKTNRIISEQNDELDKLNATKDKLFSIVSHDLRSSVNALKNSNRSLSSNLESKNIEKLKSLLNSNSTIVNGAYNLLDNLLNWALLQTKQTYFSIEEHRLYMLVEHVTYNYAGLFEEKQITFVNRVSKKDKVLVDQESFKIIIRNLLDNAIKFSNDGGEISVYSLYRKNDYCDLIIEDTGLGMSESTRQELLKETSLLSKKENEDIIGTGLGIQLCKSMIKKNKGIFSIESQIGKGTKMIVSLPKVND